MKQEHQALWSKLKSFKIDDPNVEFKFSHRLARDNGWKITYAEQVIEEYKKFIFLCCISKAGVTPSDQVDQAWHLHLTYTKSYWISLCKIILEKDIHHNPTKGGENEKSKFKSCYNDTLKLYEEVFTTSPPENVWPKNEVRFSSNQFQRINLKNYWLLKKLFLSTKLAFFIMLLPATLFLIQATNLHSLIPFIFLSIIGLVIFLVMKTQKPGGSNNDGGCSAGCSNHSDGHHGHGGDHGCSSGCSGDGCSGCGGD